MDADSLLACGAKIGTSSKEARRDSRHGKINKLTCAPRSLRDPHVQNRATMCRVSKAPMSKSEFEFCRSTLKTVFQQCNNIEFGALCVIISSLLWCFEPLREVEMAIVIDLLLSPSLVGNDGLQQKAQMSLTETKSKYEPIVYVNRDGFWTLSHPLLADFLVRCSFQDIDRKGIALAKACLIQVGRDTGLQDQHLNNPPSNTPFSAYADKFWKDHYRLVQGVSSGLTARVHFLILNGDASATTWPIPNQKEIKRALTICEQEDFHILHHVYRQLWQVEGSASPTLTVPSDFASSVDATTLQAQFRHFNIEEDGSELDDWVVIARAA